MAIFDHTIVIQAPPELVWAEICQAVAKQRIAIQQQCYLLLACDGNQGVAFYLFELPDNSTRLRRFVDDCELLEKSLAAAGLEILDDLAARGIFPTPTSEVDGKRELEDIQLEAEVSARAAHWTPRSAAKSGTTLSRLISPPTAPIGCPPWNPIHFVWLASIFSFAASGILAALNWRRLNRPKRTWPTLALTLGALFFLVGLFSWLVNVNTLFLFSAYGFNLGLAGVLAAWQAPGYQNWAAAHGKPGFRKSGLLIPILAGITAWLSIALTYSARSWLFGIALGVPSFVIMFLLFVLPWAGLSIVLRNSVRPVIDPTDLFGNQVRGDPNAQKQYAARRAYWIIHTTMPELEKALELERKSPKSFFMRGLAYLGRGEQGKAIADIEKALSLGLSEDDQALARHILSRIKS